MKSDTYNLALQAADKLLLSGVRPTQQNIRDELGKGSISTIHRALTDWWQALGPRVLEKQQTPGLPDSVSGAMIELWKLAMGEAQQQLVTQAEQVRAELKKSKQQLDAESRQNVQLVQTLNNQLTATYERLTQLDDELRQERGEKNDLQRELMRALTTQAEQRREIATLETLIETMRQESVDNEKQRVSYHAQQHEMADTQRMQRQVDQLNEENKNLKQLVSALDRQLNESEKPLNY